MFLRSAPIRIVLCCAVILCLSCSREGGDSADGADAREGAGGAEASSLVLYCGRSQSLVDALVMRYEEESGVDIRIKYGNTPELAIAIEEEGAKSPADIFWAQDAGALGALSQRGFLTTLPPALIGRVAPLFRNTKHHWVATSGRARVLAYHPDRVARDELPTSVFDLANENWNGRIGWAPANASFQSFVTAMRVMHGEQRTEQWLRAVKEGGAKTYAKNTAIIEAIFAGEVDLGLPNHYYLLRFTSENPVFSVAQTSFDAGDVGNLVNIAGVGILQSSAKVKNAEDFVRFLLSEETQLYFREETYEYPVYPAGNAPHPGLLELTDLMALAPDVELADLEDLDGTLDVLRKVGLL